MAALSVTRYTPEEYLALERAAEFRSEYYIGEIFAMAGGSRAHARITMNLSIGIGSQLRGRPCEAHAHLIRVEIDHGRAYVYPDLVAVCGEAIFKDAAFDTLTNPSLVIEVLSPSTEGYDRGLKAALYRQIESLREYVLVAQDRVSVELFRRTEDGAWRLIDLREPSDTLSLESIGCAVTLADVYERVALPTDGEPIQKTE